MTLEGEAKLGPTVAAWDRPASVLLHWLVLAHRWAGIVLCGVFAIWCISGAIFLFVPYPELSYKGWLTRNPAIDFQKLAVAPSVAIASAGGGSAIYLIDVAGEPVYMISGARGARGAVAAVSGVTGQAVKQLSPQQARVVAEKFEHDTAARVDGPMDYDPWVVRARLNGWRPFYKVTFADPENTFVYVAANTGEVVQRAQFRERAWTWFGGITHWVYFVPVAQYKLWDPGVWSLGLVSTTVVLMGIWLGTYRSVKQARKPRPGLSPYRGWMRQHHVFGLAASLLLLAYIVSGWLALDHGRMFSQTLMDRQQITGYQGGALAVVLRPVSVEQLRAAAPARRVRIVALAGHAVVTAEEPDGARSEIVDKTGVRPVASVPVDLFAAAAAAAWPGDRVRSVTQAASDDVHILTEAVQTYERGQVVGQPLAVRLDGPMPIRLYVDAATGRVIAARDRNHLVYDWIYWVMHTYNFPGLSSRPWLRIGISLFAVAMILAFVTTAGVIGIKRLRRVAA